MITVLFFGPVAERTGASRMEFEFRAGLRLRDLREDLQRQYSEAFELVSVSAVNGTRVSDMDVELPDHSEVVFMSKFSGG